MDHDEEQLTVNTERQQEELESLYAFYGEDGVCVQHDGQHAAGGPSWTLKIAPGMDLVIQLCPQYPSQEAPTPRIRAPSYVLSDQRRAELESELTELYQEDTEVSILWTEHLKAALGDTNDRNEVDENEQDNTENFEEEIEGARAGEVSRVFHPSSSKFGQPARHFDASVVNDDSNRRPIHRGRPYHPPKSGPAETLVAHVAAVESLDNVNWVLAQLLLEDKKVAKASHNMIAYRFYDEKRDCFVSDNDDDGEKGAGTKLAALLEMADCRNVIVVVSRWYGGIHLGSARFKYFASVARDALEEAGFLPSRSKK